MRNQVLFLEKMDSDTPRIVGTCWVGSPRGMESDGHISLTLSDIKPCH